MPARRGVGHAEGVGRRRNGVRASVRALSSSVAGATVADAAGRGGDGQPVPDGAACRAERDAGFHDDHLHGPDGRVYRRTGAHITPGRAQDLLRTGAAMAIDDCGCGGYCGLDWASPAECVRLGLRPPRLTRCRFGWLDEWRTADGHGLLVQSGDVRWP